MKPEKIEDHLCSVIVVTYLQIYVCHTVHSYTLLPSQSQSMACLCWQVLVSHSSSFFS